MQPGVALNGGFSANHFDVAIHPPTFRIGFLSLTMPLNVNYCITHVDQPRYWGGRNKSQRGSRIMGVVGGWPHDILEARNDNYNTTQFIYTYQTMIARLPYKP